MARVNPRAIGFTGVFAAAAIIVWMSWDRARLQTQVANLKSEVVSLGERARPAAERPALAPLRTGEPAKSISPPPSARNESASANWNDPTWRAARFNEALLRAEAKYGRLFGRLQDWPPERREALKRLMADNELRLLRAMESDAPMNPEGMQARIEALSQATNENNRLLRETMGEEDYARLERFERERSSTESVATITNSMRANGFEVSNDLEESILRSYSAALHEAAQQASAADTRSLQPVQLEELKRQQYDAFHQILLNRMSSILDEEQLNAFMASMIEQDA